MEVIPSLAGRGRILQKLSAGNVGQSGGYGPRLHDLLRCIRERKVSFIRHGWTPKGLAALKTVEKSQDRANLYQEGRQISKNDKKAKDIG